MRCQCRGQPGCGGVEAPRRNVALPGSLWGSWGAPSVACHGGLLRAPQERRWREKEAVPAFYKPISEATSQQVYCLPFVNNARPWIQPARRRRASCRVRGPGGQGHREPPRKQPPGAYTRRLSLLHAGGAQLTRSLGPSVTGTSRASALACHLVSSGTPHKGHGVFHLRQGGPPAPHPHSPGQRGARCVTRAWSSGRHCARGWPVLICGPAGAPRGHRAPPSPRRAPAPCWEVAGDRTDRRPHSHPSEGR